jgi:hypothetical protein
VLNLKSVNKIKSGNFFPRYDPSKEVCFFHFHGFIDFERAVALLLVEIFLNFENGKKHVQAVPKTYNNHLFQVSFHAQNAV